MKKKCVCCNKYGATYCSRCFEELWEDRDDLEKRVLKAFKLLGKAIPPPEQDRSGWINVIKAEKVLRRCKVI